MGQQLQFHDVERDLAQMELAGVNAVRTMFMFDSYTCPSEGTLGTTLVNNLKDFLNRAQNHGIKVTLTVGLSVPTWLSNRIVVEYGGWYQWSELWTSHLFRQELADFLVQLCNTANLGQYESFMAFDLQNEPMFAYYNGTAQDFYDCLSNPTGSSNAVLRSWNRWVNAKYASLDNAYAAWNYTGTNDTSYTVYPEIRDHFTSSGSWDKKVDDYYSFIADCFSTTITYIRDRVRTEALARALFTINPAAGIPTDSITADIQEVQKLTSDYRRISEACDFASLHLYFNSADPSTWRDYLVYFASMGTDMPACITEFGHPANPSDSNALEFQRRDWEKMLSIAREARLDGILGWMWIDTAGASPNYFGIRTNANAAKSAYNQFAQDNINIQLSATRTADRTVEVDMNSYITPWQRFYSDGRSLIKARFDAGQYPDMISKGWQCPINDTIYHLPIQGGDPVVGSMGYGAARGAVILSDSVPDFMVSGLTYTPQVTTWNVGTNSWTEANLYRLGVEDSIFGVGRWALNGGETITQWGTRSFPMTLTAPATPGTYTRNWRMVQDGVAWFGQGHSHPVKVVAKPTRGAKITSHTIPESVAQSQVFNVSVTVRNEGTETWTRAAGHKLGASGDSDPFATNRQLLASNDSIATGQSKTFTFQMTAPATHKVLQSDWQMVKEGVAWFGQKIDVEVNVE